HREEVMPIDGAELVGLNDIRMIELRRETRLVEEHGLDLVILGDAVLQPLDYDELAEALGTARNGRVDIGHSALPAFCEELIPPKDGVVAEAKPNDARRRDRHASMLTRCVGT